ncbi:DUF2785 domain-containing protein [Proteiniborus sp. MB09-C3]|uniref:DUF2785 domain-containing protein n=1 Tax=Proteiniborus sp. MB09-C3 TaxID=3050072 RepID=UPI0025578DB0|nr:DUF2785 domain-containing protein [Proteiniborus sp. MB09-C3]WIV12707.1 DUF2785 domain-containing protein [Proteiniborus sp. MB09-C3]
MPNVLKRMLKQIKEENYSVPTNVNVNDIVLEMMNNIGNTDPELRDKLIYSIMFYWIKDNKITIDKLKELLAISIDDNHLFFRIGETDTDSVFTRSFSILLVPLILMKHGQNNFLSERDIHEVYAKVVDYFIKEQDLRGYVKDKGWAHSIAHAADALDDLAICSEIGREDLLYMLEIIKKKVFINNYVYINEEDERLVTAIVSILNRNLISNKDFCEWIKSFSNIEKTGIYPEDDNLLANVKNMLRSLYFRIIDLDNTKILAEEIKNTLAKISNFN